MPLPAALSPLSVPAYRTYIVGQATASTGTWMQSVAQDWLVLSLTHDPSAVGLVMAAQFGPFLAFGMAGGAIADRFSRRRVLLVTSTASAALTLLLALVCLLGHVSAWQVGLIALAGGMVQVVDNPTRQSFVGEVVPVTHLRAAVSLNSAVFQTSRLVGPAISAVLLDAAGAGWAFAGAAACALGPVAALTKLQRAQLQPVPRHAPGERAGRLRAALAHVRERPQVAWTIVLVGVVGMFGLNFPIVLSAMAKSSFAGTWGTGADRYGLFNIVLAASSATGALLAGSRTHVRLRALVVLVVLFGAAQASAALAPDLLAFCVLIAGMGVANLALQSMANSSVQLWCEPAFRGRVMGLYLLVFIGGTPIGAPIVGAVTSAAGARVGMLLCGAVPVVVALVVGLLLLRATARRRGAAAEWVPAA